METEKKYALFHDPMFPANAGMHGGAPVGVEVVGSSTIILIQMWGCQNGGLLTSVSEGRFKNGPLVKRNRGCVEETRTHLRTRELWLFLEIILIVGPEGGGKGRDGVSQGREFHFLNRDLGGVILHMRGEEYVFVLHVTGLAH